jgi:hypothetical protein
MGISDDKPLCDGIKGCEQSQVIKKHSTFRPKQRVKSCPLVSVAVRRNKGPTTRGVKGWQKRDDQSGYDMRCRMYIGTGSGGVDAVEVKMEVDVKPSHLFILV